MAGQHLGDSTPASVPVSDSNTTSGPPAPGTRQCRRLRLLPRPAHTLASTASNAGTAAAAAPAPAPAVTAEAPVDTRTRRNHGAFTLGAHLTCIYSWRNPARRHAVSFEIGADTLRLAANMTAAQARVMARALSAAADAADALQVAVLPLQKGGAA